MIAEFLVAAGTACCGLADAGECATGGLLGMAADIGARRATAPAALVGAPGTEFRFDVAVRVAFTAARFCPQHIV